MTAFASSSRATISLVSSASKQAVVAQPARQAGRRCNSTAAAAAAAVTPSAPSPASSSSLPNVNVSLVLSRQPIVLRTPHPLESSVFQYNHSLSRKVSQPFVKDFYFRKGSAAETRFDEEERQRAQAFDAAYSSSAKSSSGKSASKSSQSNTGSDALKSDAELYATTSRTTKADETGDITSLERALDRTLFLVTRNSPSSQWRFPTTNVDIARGETLHKVAKRPVEAALGDKMDIWLVSNMPIGVSPRPSQQTAQKKTPQQSDKTYFLRAHVLSGLAEEAKGGSEFAWLTQEEIKDKMAGDSYFAEIKDLLSK